VLDAETREREIDFRQLSDSLDVINAVDGTADLNHGIGSEEIKCEERREAHFEQGDVPARVLHLVESGDGQWNVPVLDGARIGVEGGEKKLQIHVVDANARFGKVIDVHEEGFEEVGHREGGWRRGEERVGFLISKISLM
jgi:hypothetical protein